MKLAARAHAMLAGLLAATSVLAISAGAQTPADHHVPSRPNTVVWGEIPIERPPVLTIRSGATVTIDTLSHSGATRDEDPVTFLGARGVLADGYPGTRPTDAKPVGGPRVIRTRTENGRGVADLTPALVVPLRPFMGIMAVAPASPRIGQPGITVDGVQSTRPPGPFGGNLDYKDLGPGSTLFLPVFRRR